MHILSPETQTSRLLNLVISQWKHYVDVIVQSLVHWLWSWVWSSLWVSNLVGLNRLYLLHWQGWLLSGIIQQTTNCWYFPPKKRIQDFMQIVSTGDNLLEMSNPVFGKNKKNISICCLLKILLRVLCINSVHHSSNWDVNWRTPVWWETSTVQV